MDQNNADRIASPFGWTEALKARAMLSRQVWDFFRDEVLTTCASSTQTHSNGRSFDVVEVENSEVTPAVNVRACNDDGPYRVGCFRFQGVEHKVPLTPWLVLNAMWPNRFVDEEELVEAVWGVNSTAKSGKVKVAINRLNDLLITATFDRFVHQKNGKVFWDCESYEIETPS